MKRVLYIDVPFYGIHGGDKNRSNFLWQAINSNYQADLLLLMGKESGQSYHKHPCSNKTFEILISSNKFFQAHSIYNFTKSELNKFQKIISENKYDVVFLRFNSPALLAEIAKKVLPQVQIIVDVDMLFSRIASLNWNHKPNWKNRYFFLEKIKLDRFERKFFQNDYKFLFTNSQEKDFISSKFNPKNGRERFFLLPNMFSRIDQAKVDEIGKKNYILIFGTMNSVANQDGFKFFVEDIYPKIRASLSDKNIKVFVVGKNPQAYQFTYEDEFLKVIGAVDDINSYIKNAILVLLPLRIASGTRTRILEVAEWEKVIITTSIGAEGFDLSPQEIIIEDEAEEIANKLLDVVNKPEKYQEMGKKLLQKCLTKYEQNVVVKQLTDLINSNVSEKSNKSGVGMTKNRTRKICIVTNRFYPEVGGAETNIYFQARMLAKTNDVTVICPKRIDKPFLEILDGITVYRLKDMYNRKKIYPNMKAKTLCLDVFGIILFGNFDVVQVFPAMNPNNMIAFFACKLSRTPIVLASFDFLDYASIIKEKGSINPDILRFYQPAPKQVFFLKRFDYIFAISDKEIEFYRKFNNNVAYSPVPILVDEYKREIENPRLKYNITQSDFVYLVLGRICNVKGQDIALRAFNQVSKQITKSKLIFVGRYDYEPEFYEEMQKYIEKNELKDKVIFTGMIEREEVLGWLKHSDIHIIPVRFMNSGAVVVESWMSETPVIQSSVVDPNLVEEDVNGYLFPREDAKVCSQKMIKAYNNRTELKKMALAGKKLVEKKYTYEYLTNLYLQVYDEIQKR